MFQSTHPHGVRQKPTLQLHEVRSFNPRTHTGCDQGVWIGSGQFRSFNPRTHTGCDSVSKMIGLLLHTFQSTHPHGVRLACWYFAHDGYAFQSTHPHGVRLRVYFSLIFLYFISIHAPTRGATPIKIIINFLVSKFQSTHPHGVRRKTNGIWTNGTEFQSTHPHGVRHAKHDT